MKEWEMTDWRNASWTINQYGEGTWEDLGRGGTNREKERGMT
jgi:hypothetical protein